MLSMKSIRHAVILEIIKEQDIETQEELAEALRQRNIRVTQATVSRDIKDLGIIKVTLPSGGTKYSVLDRTGDVAPGRLLSVFAHSV